MIVIIRVRFGLTQLSIPPDLTKVRNILYTNNDQHHVGLILALTSENGAAGTKGHSCGGGGGCAGGRGVPLGAVPALSWYGGSVCEE